MFLSFRAAPESKRFFFGRLPSESKLYTLEINISTANLKQDDESVGDCDADGHGKDDVVDDEHLVGEEG